MTPCCLCLAACKAVAAAMRWGSAAIDTERIYRYYQVGAVRII